MAPERWIVNASPLILLGKANQLALLGALAEQIEIPQAVVTEVSAKPDGKTTIQRIAETAPYSVIDDQAVNPTIFSWDLGAGETQVIASALARGADRVVIDDLEARRCARAMGLRVIGTLGIIGRAKVAGQIDQARPIILRLREVGFYVSDELAERLLHEVGE